MTADWPTEAREAVITALVIEWSETGVSPTREQMAPAADAVIAALAPHVQPRTDDWEWGVISPGDLVPYLCSSETSARRIAAKVPHQPSRLLRRPAGGWEVAP